MFARSITRFVFCYLAVVLPICPNVAGAQDASSRFRIVRGTSGKLYRVYRPSYPSSSTSGVSAKRNATRGPYRLDAGDVVAVIVQGVTVEFNDAPVHMPKEGDGTFPAVGHPMVVLRDGTLPMPLIDPISVRGLTVTQARDKIGRVYKDQRILKKDNLVTLSLMRKRTVNVSVLHDNPYLGTRVVSNVQVPADKRNVIQALAQSGTFDAGGKVSVIQSGTGRRMSSSSQLKEGDMVHIQSKPAGYFFTGGNLRGGQYALPNDRPMNALQAISAAGGLRQQGLFGPSEVTIIRSGGGAIRMSYAQLLNQPNAVRILRGDTLIVR